MESERRKFYSQEEINEYLENDKKNQDDFLDSDVFFCVLSDCDFYCEVSFYNGDIFESILKENLSPERFEYANFTNSIFFEKVNFSEVSFLGTVKFENTTFKKEVIFNDSKFNYKDSLGDKAKYKTIFTKCTFEKMASFRNTKFYSICNFNECTFQEYANFQGVSFQDKVNFSNISGNGTLDFSYVNFEQNAYFYEAGIKRINLEKCVTDKGLFFLKARIKKANRETCRIIKHEFIKQNNKIESLQYHRREMQQYWCDLAREIRRSPFQFRKTTNNLGNLFLLSLNYISSGFGLWWFMGVAFTFVTTFLVFLWYVHFVTAWDGKLGFSLFIGNGNSQFWRYYFQFLLPTHHVEFMSALNPKDGAFIVDVIGRIVSSFGIYQTVQAFRKYGKN